MPILPQTSASEERLESETSAGAPGRHRARGRDPARPVATFKHNLPHLASRFVGRHDDIAEVGALLDDFRLVTLTGPGGMGKTRLALEVAGRSASRPSDGIWMVELADVADEAGLRVAVMAAIGDGALPAPSVEDVARTIGHRRLLLLVDNCEHLVDDSARLVEHLLRSCPGLSVLVTSRVALGIMGERTWIVRPLTLPDPRDVTADSLLASESGELFLSRAADIKPRFLLNDAIAGTIAEICRRVDGMPLAIELAAMRVTSLSPADILVRLEDDPFRLLSSGSPTTAVRHRSLLGNLEWSHDLLTPKEAVLLRRLSVFDGWTLAAAEEVCGTEPLDRRDIVDHLAALVSKSLVVVEEDDEGLRYHLFETIGKWAATKLEAEDESIAVHRAHALWCVTLAADAEKELAGRHPKPWIDDLEIEHDNLLAALTWAKSSGELEIGCRLAGSLSKFWELSGRIEEAKRWLLGWAVEVSGDLPPALKAKVLRAAGLVRGLQGDIMSAIPLLEKSSELYAQSGDDEASVCACRTTFLMMRDPRSVLPQLEEQAAECHRTSTTDTLGHLHHSMGQAHYILCALDDARRHFQECCNLGRGAADTEVLAGGLLGLCRVNLLLGDLVAAKTSAAEALAEAEAAGSDDDAALALGFLGEIARLQGRWEKARDLLDQAETRARYGGMPVGIARALYFKARLAEWEGDPEAASTFETSLVLAGGSQGPVFHEVRCCLGIGAAAELRGDLDEARARYLEVLTLAKGVGDLVVVAEALLRLSGVAVRQGKGDDASVLGHDALELYQSIGARPGIASSLEHLAGLVADGRPEQAARLFAAAQAVRDPDGYGRSRPDQERYEAALARLQAGLGHDAFDAAWAEGTALSIEEAVAYALRGRRTDRPVTGLDSLTTAEKEVVRLVCEGLSNPEVGKRLFISPRTVGHHLAHVYDKLGVRSRGALAKELAGRDL